MTVSFWQQAHREQATAYDVVIVGGGIIGCATAYWLGRRRPSLDVALLEARTLGAGASGRNAGFVLQGTATDFLTDVERYGERTARRLWRFTRTSRDQMASELRGSAFGWASDGSLTVAGDPEEEERLRASVSHLRAAGAPVVFLDEKKTNQRLHATGLYGGLYVTTGGVVNPLHLVQHLAAESGADIRTHHPVEEIEWSGGYATLQTPNLRITGRQVVLAVGPALPKLVPSLARYVRPVRAQMLATEPAGSPTIPVPAYSHDGEFYVRQLSDGTVLVGGGRHHHREAEDTAADATTPAVQATIERYLHTHFPWTKTLAVRRRWSGTMGFSPDGRPVIGPVPGHPQSVFATGFTGHGMGYGFRMGRLLARRVCGTTRPDGYDLFAASRFDDETPDETNTRHRSPNRWSVREET
jgi:glycine/D-amino acid oxidase-like deaminating enzyme